MTQVLLKQVRDSFQAGDLVTAEVTCLQILENDPEDPMGLFWLGMIYQRTGNLEIAVDLFEQASLQCPSAPAFHFHLGLCLKSLADVAKAEDCFRRTLGLNPDFAPAHYQLGQILFYRQKRDEASVALQNALTLGLTDPNLRFDLAITYVEQNKTQEAIDLFEKIYQDDPDNLAAFLHACLSLPILYMNSEEIQIWRERYAHGLERVLRKFEESTLSPRYKQKSIARFSPYYLNYQGQNDKELQVQYGHLVSQITKEIYPQHSGVMPEIKDRIRIGFLSASLFSHCVARSSWSWVEGLHRDHFKIHCYYIGTQTDAMTEKYRKISDSFHHFPEQIDATVQQIISDDLHILVFLDIGMHPLITQIASLRLAPIQCVRWGHPITTGLPTIDYYFSSGVMEPSHGQDHYSEHLVLLPGLGKALRESADPEHFYRKRSEYNLPENKILYLSSQSLIKYLPVYDEVYPRLIAKIPEAQIVFLARANSARVIEQFVERMQDAFASYALDWSQSCILLPRLSYRDYLSLNFCCDVFLDSFSWSGDNTVLDAIGCGLPVVTCPGEFMRSRHGAGILTYLGITELVTPTIDDYLEVAVKLGRDTAYRSRISEQIKLRHQALIGDRQHVAFLERFYWQIIHQRLADQSQTDLEQGD